MNYQQIFREAKEANYSDEEITNYLLENDPHFEKVIGGAKDAGYSPKEVLNYFNSATAPKEEAMGPGDYLADFGKQGAQGFGIGALGTYGDILGVLGLQGQSAADKESAEYNRESEILAKEKPSAAEILELSGDEDIVPKRFKLPSSEDVEEAGKHMGAVSEPKSAAGRYGRRIGKLGGGGLALGSTAIASPIVAGIAGQTMEELGMPAWAQAAAEIIATLKLGKKTSVPVTSKSKEVEKVLTDLRKAGYTEKDLTLAKSALEERKILKKYASMTPEAENAIQQGVKNSEELLKKQIKEGLPGYAEGGLPYLKKQANNVYGAMEELASNVPISNKEPVRKSIEKSIAYLEKYPLLDEQKKFVEFLKDGLTKLDKADTAEFFTGFYRNLGKAGNWGDPKQKEHLLGIVKQGIKDTFSQSGPEGAKFGKYFDATNDAWKKWLNAEDLMTTIEKAQNVDGTNFKRLASILNDPQNHELAKKVLGPEPLNNIKAITEGVGAIESLIKQIPKSDKSIQSLKVLEGLRSLFTGDYKPMAAIITMEGAKRLATSLLIDPEKQNIMKRLIIAAKNNSPQQAMILAQELITKHSAQAKEEEPRRPKSAK